MKDIALINKTLLDLSKAVDAGQNTSVFGLSFGEKALFLCRQKRQVVFVSNSVADAIKLEEEMKSFGKITKTILYSPSDCFSLGSSTFGENVVSSIDALLSLSQKKVDCVIISPLVLMQKFAKKDIFSNSTINLKVGQTINLKDLIQNLINIGYRRVDTVSRSGELCLHGDTLNIFDILSDNPTKIEFFDNEIETISQYDIETYKKISEKQKLIVAPTSTFVFDIETKSQIFDLLSKDFEKTVKTLEPNEAVKLKTNFEEFKVNFNANNFEYVKNWLLPFSNSTSIESYFDKDALIIFDDVKQIVDSIKNEYSQFLNLYDMQKASGGALIGHKNYFIPETDVFDFKSQLLSFQNITTANRIFTPQFVASYKSSSTTNYFGNYDLLCDDIKYYLEFDYSVIVFTGAENKTKYLQNFLTSKNIDVSRIEILNDHVPYGAVFVEDKVVIVGSAELNKKASQKKVASQNKKEEFTMPKIGDYVVHENFGIGLCVGIEKLKFTDYQKDYIILQYDKGDKLYLPTEQIGLISAYVSNGKAPKLNKLGSKDFENTKAKVRTSLKQLAFNLVELYRERENEKGFKFEVDNNLYDEFEKSFPYEETPDQLSAVEDVLHDMTSSKIMDRIVCGDVGYGKTEVALRGAFVSAINGKQTAFLAPTTILTEQHFNTAKSRFANFGIVVECLNRFKTKTEQKAILEKLKKGEIDIICGTHRLLSNDVQFKDLGLLILDEEQRFGVADKEKIKRLKTNVDVLTLSATPIPRTLHMGLVGIRDISIIASPPSDRLPVQTTVAEYSDAIILNAIKRELSRGGQVLIVYNRVEGIYNFSRHIRDLIGEDISIGVAHGQMETKELEDQILKLYRGDTRVLISTTLIENGIDLPSANTLIIIDADKLGLSQLYQLKGRVGRSKDLGYAYFTFDKDKALSEDAYKRLNAIMEFTELGSGFKIAMKDLEIRGCGNILGAEQSGHMAKVGYDMYCKILNEAVSEIKGQKQKEYLDIKLDVATNCYIPENYIDGSESRFRVYNNLKQINSTEKKQSVLQEVESLYGKLPEEIENLANVALLRNLAREFDVKKISIDRERCQAEFYSKEKMLDKNIASSLKNLGYRCYFSQTGIVMNFMLSEYSVKKKLSILCDIFEDAFKKQENNNGKNRTKKTK